MDGIHQVSVVMAARDKGYCLNAVLGSIDRQPVVGEIIVVDDGSRDDTPDICKSFDRVNYIQLDDEGYRNPAFARNVGFSRVNYDKVVIQSADVEHLTENAIELLALPIQSSEFHIATVVDSETGIVLTGLENQRPFFFLGALDTWNLWSVGGDSEDFVEPGFDDDWFGNCLVHGLGLRPVFRGEVKALHHSHSRSTTDYAKSEKVYRRKLDQRSWFNGGLRRS